MRCDAELTHGIHPRSVSRAFALSLTAFVLYPVAMTLPVMQIERFGHLSEESIWSGMMGLFEDGYWVVGVMVCLFSIVAPVGKVLAMMVLCFVAIQKRSGHVTQDRSSAGFARLYRLVEFVGRWGMADVMLVAVLIAIVKLGDVVQVQPGAGVSVFVAVVLLSICASLLFDPAMLWSEDVNVGIESGSSR